MKKLVTLLLFILLTFVLANGCSKISDTTTQSTTSPTSSFFPNTQYDSLTNH